MPPELIWWLVPLALACCSVVVSVWISRHTRANPDQADVDELAIEVARIAKQVRRDRMRAVRAGEGDAENPSLAGSGPPPELGAAAATLPPSADVDKNELRRRVFGQGR
jgi:hypothetical protein